MEQELKEALQDIVWKLNRKVLDSEGKYIWAKIDIHDVVIRHAIELIEGMTSKTENAF